MFEARLVTLSATDVAADVRRLGRKLPYRNDRFS
jgi:hypothetical protein